MILIFLFFNSAYAENQSVVCTELMQKFGQCSPNATPIPDPNTCYSGSTDPACRGGDDPTAESPSTSSSSCQTKCDGTGMKKSTCMTDCILQEDIAACNAQGKDYSEDTEGCVDRSNNTAKKNPDACQSAVTTAYNKCEGRKQEMQNLISEMNKVTANISSDKNKSILEKCNPISEYTDSAEDKIKEFKSTCDSAATSCQSACSDYPSELTKCNASADMASTAAVNASKGAIKQLNGECLEIAQKLTQLGQMMSNSSSGSAKSYMPPGSSIGSIPLPGLQGKPGAISNQSSLSPSQAATTAGSSKKGLGATDMGSLMNGGEDSEFGGSQVQAGKAGQGGGGSGFGGSGGGLAGKNSNQKGGQQAANKGLNWGKGYLGGSSGPSFGGGAGSNPSNSDGQNKNANMNAQNSKIQTPDWRKFLPGGQYDPRRGIAGVTGPDGITGPATDLFGKVHNRYGAVGHTLKP